MDLEGTAFDHEKNRQYRFAEVMLHLKWKSPSDLWPARCIIVLLFREDLLSSMYMNWIVGEVFMIILVD